MENPFAIGDQVLASRAEDGTGHEQGQVVDAYTLLIGPESRPMVVVEFPDGGRAYLRAEGEDVLPLPVEEEEPGAG
jgi:hypothetical protein